MLKRTYHELVLSLCFVGLRRLLSIGNRTYDLKGQLKKMMFKQETMKPVTLDVGVFVMVMSTFAQFEKSVKSVSNSSHKLLTCSVLSLL